MNLRNILSRSIAKSLELRSFVTGAIKTDAVNDDSPRVTALEERIMLSATPMAVVADVPTVDSADSPECIAEENDASQDSTVQTVTNVVFVDSSIDDYQTLVDDINQEADNSTVVLIDGSSDGVAQITDYLSNQTAIESVHIVSHGTDGEVKLGNTVLNADTIERYAGQIASWGNALASSADILFYGCDLAATSDGQLVIESLSALTGADIVASDDLTGHADLGGDWDLEYAVGQIETDVIFSVEVQENWLGTLQTFEVTTLEDVVNGDTSSHAALVANDGGDGISLREAIITVNNGAGGDTILLGAGVHILSMGGTGDAGGDLDINENVTIIGVTAETSVIDATGLGDRVFNVLNGDATFQNLTITGGDTTGAGGGIRVNAGRTAIVDNVVVTQNNAASAGGGIFSSGTLTVTNSTISDNTATLIDGNVGAAGGGIAQSSGVLRLDSVTVSGNSADTDGGGVHLSNGSHFLTNVTVSGNDATEEGGGVYVAQSGTGNLSHVTITNNTAGTEGGGITNKNSQGTINVTGSIIAGNHGSVGTENVSGDINPNGINIVSDEPGLSLGTLADNGGPVQTHELLAGSVAAIDTGGPADPGETDARGVLVTDGFRDLGAFERISAQVNNTPPIFDNLDDNPTFVLGGNPVTLDVDVTISDADVTATGNFDGARLMINEFGGHTLGINGLQAADGQPIVVSEVEIGAVGSINNGFREFHFNSDATNLLVNEFLQSITYEYTDATPPPQSFINLTWTFDDGAGGETNGQVTVNIQDAINLGIVAPALVTTTEDTPLVLSGTNAVSVDDGITEDSVIQVSLSVANGTLNLADLNGITFVEGSDGSGSFVIEGLESVLNVALDGLTFTPDGDFNGPDTLNITTSTSTGLAGHYTFDDGSASDQAAGSADDADNGTFNGGATTVTDPERGEVLSLNGEGDRVEIPGLFGEPTSVTLAAWVNLTSADAWGAEVISLGDNIQLRLDDRNDGVILSVRDGDIWEHIVSDVYIAGTGWRHVAATFDDVTNTQTVYLDGVAIATDNLTNPISYNLAENTVIGGHGNGNTELDFDGLIDDARVYTRALNAAEVAALAAGQTEINESVAITVTPVNDAPVVSGPGSAFNFTEQGSLDIHGTGFSVTDLDGNGAALSATLTVGEGRLLLDAGDSGVTIESGNSTDTVTITGSETQLNALLNGTSSGTIVYLNDQTVASDTPSASTTITLTVNDQGNTGTDPGLTGDDNSEEHSASQTISVAAVNDAPTLLGTELITNGDFASAGLSDWTTTGEVNVFVDDQLSFGSGNTAGPHTASQTIDTVAGQTYVLEFDYRDVGSALPKNQQLNVSVNGSGNLLSTEAILTDSDGQALVRYRYTFTADSSSATIKFTDTSDNVDSMSNGTEGVDGRIDNVSVRQSNGSLNSVAFIRADGPVILNSGIEAADAELSGANDFGGATLTLEIVDGASADDDILAVNNLAFAGSTFELSGVPKGTFAEVNGALVLTFAQGVTNAEVNEILQSIAYRNLSDNPPASVDVQWTFNDSNGTAQGTGGALAAVGTTTVEIINEAPTTADVIIDANENVAFVPIELQGSDSDGTVASYVITTLPTGGTLYLDSSLTTAIVAGVDYPGPTQDVFFVPDPDFAGVVTFEYQARDDDGLLAASPATVTIDVATVNDAPEIANLDGDFLTYFEGDGAVVIDGGMAVTITDVDSANFDGGNLTVSSNAAGDDSATQLSIRNQGTGAGQIGLDGTTVTYQNVVIGTTSGGSNGADLIVTLNANADAEAVSALSQNVTYENSDNDNLTEQAQTISFTVNDGDGGTSVSSDVLLELNRVNDAPVISGGPATPVLTETDAGLTASSVFVVSDVDSTAFTAAVDSVVVTGSGSPPASLEATLQSFLTVGSTVASTGSGTTNLVTWNFDSGTEAFDFLATGETLILTYTVSVSDNDATPMSDTETVTVTIVGTNDAPTTSVVTLSAIAEDSGVRIITQAELLANAADVEGDALTATGLISSGNGILADNGDGTWSYTPAANDDSDVSFSYDITDSTDSVAGNATLDITPVNDAPTTAPVGFFPIGEDGGVRLITQLQLLVNASDIEGDGLTATGLVISSGNGTLVDNLDGTWSYTPAANDDSNVSFSFNVSDGVTSVLTTATLDIIPFNDAPVVDLDADDSSGTTGLDFNTSFAAGGTPIGLTNGASVADVDSTIQTLTIQIANIQDGAEEVLSFTSDPNIDPVYSPTEGLLRLIGNSNATNSDFAAVINSLTYENTSATPDTRTREITFVANDGALDSLVATTFVSLIGDVTAPTAGNNIGSNVIEGGTDVIETAELSYTDDLQSTSDIEYSVTSGTSNGFLALASDPATPITSFTQADIDAGNLVYIHDGFETDSDSFTFTVDDGQGNSLAGETFNITVLPKNDRPENIVPVNQVTDEDTPLVFNSTNGNQISISDSDTADSLVEVTLSAGNGTITLGSTAGINITNGTGVNDTTITFQATQTSANIALNGLSFSPTADFNGSAFIDILTNDLGNSGFGGALVDGDFIDITVDPINDDPVLLGDAASFVTEGATVVGTFVAVDSDGDTLTYSLVGVDAGLFNINSSTGEVSFAAAPDFETPLDSNGDNVYEITVVATDDGSLTDSQNISVNVTNVNEAPVLPSDTTLSVDEGTTSIGAFAGADADGDTLTYSLVGADAGLFNIDGSTGEVSFASAPNFETPLDSNGDNVYEISVVVTDDGTGSLSDIQDLRVTVNDTNEATVSQVTDVDAGTNTVDENSAVGTSVGITANAVDVDGTDNVVTYRLLDDDGGRFAINPTSGEITVNGDIDFETDGADRDIVVRAESADGSVSDQTFTLAINDVNETPTVSISGVVFSVPETTDTTDGIHVADIVVNDDALGNNQLSLSGVHAGDFEIVGNELRLRPGTELNFDDLSQYDVNVDVNDATIGGAVDDSASYTLDVVDISAPVSNNDVYVINQFEEALIAVDSVLLSDTVSTGQELVANLVSNASNGNVVLNPDGTFVYTPNENFSGTDFFTYQASSAFAIGNVATVEINVLPVAVSVGPGSNDSPGSQTPDDGQTESQENNDSPANEIPASEDSMDKETTESTTDDPVSTISVIDSFVDRRNGSQTNDSLDVESEEEAVPLDETIDGVNLLYGQSVDGRGRVQMRIDQVALAFDAPERIDGFGLLNLSDSSLFPAHSPMSESSSDQNFKEVVSGTYVITTATFSVGYVLWLIRGGSLLASFSSAVPLWASLDPLAVVAVSEDDRDTEDNESLVEITNSIANERSSTDE